MAKAQRQYKNKLSRSYRFKKRTGKVKQQTDDTSTEKNEITKPRIVIRNLSFQTTESELRKLYEPFGNVTDINLLKRPDGKVVGCGFVQFKNLEDASKAIFKTNKSNFLGRTISCEWAIPKSQFSEKLKKEREGVKNEFENKKLTIEEEQNIKKSVTENNFKEKNKDLPKKNSLSKAEQRKLYKLKKRQKRSRIVIRNLPFSVTKELIEERFSKYGNVEEIKILKKSDGTLTGCCFLQFECVQSAAQAIHYENMKPLLDRPMIVDWAIPKDKFQKTNENATIKDEENVDKEITFIKDEMSIEKHSKEDEIEIKVEKESDSEEINQQDGSNDQNSDSNNRKMNGKVKNGDDDDDNSNDNDDDDDDDDDDKYDENDDNKEISSKKKLKQYIGNSSGVSSAPSHSHHVSNDVNEGKTVFVKNIPFSATNEDLKECMQQFGPVYYALVCIDPLTEHSKGTAFVKFRNVEDAEKCLAAGTELKLHNQILDPHKALHRNEVNRKNEEKKQKIKDSRNLYLVKEGVVLAGSAAAQDVSASDMARRLQLEQWKSQMLRNLNMFVSRVRLVIHNLPPTCDDTKLRQLFKKHSNPGAIITEARVMRDLKNVDANGIGKSKEHGFVSFSKHEDALKALRSLNNNPNIFTKTKRPIVSFSIENRVMVNAKQKRLEKSRQHNPQWKEKRSVEEIEGEASNNDAELSQKRTKRNENTMDISCNSEELDAFAGVTGKPGITKTNGKFFLKKQAALHAQHLKQKKKKQKNLKRLTAKKIEETASRKEAKPKQGHKNSDVDETNFSRLVNSYKNELSTVSNFKSKWYES